METNFGICFFVCLIIVLTVPMRNGNIFKPIVLPPSVLVLTVPMRNGNSVADIIISLLLNGSYRTYEEWKRDWVSQEDVDAFCSYRTYEEWKLLDDTRSSTWNLSSYRTYEEWKLDFAAK